MEGANLRREGSRLRREGLRRKGASINSVVMEQMFNFISRDVGGLEGLKKVIDEDFISKARARFNDMFMQLRDSLQ